MHLVLTFGALTVAIIAIVAFAIGVAVGENKRRAEKIRVKMEAKMEAKRLRHENRVARRNQMKKTIQKLLPWRRNNSLWPEKIEANDKLNEAGRRLWPDQKN
jgi:hypothetical protein